MLFQQLQGRQASSNLALFLTASEDKSSYTVHSDLCSLLAVPAFSFHKLKSAGGHFKAQSDRNVDNDSMIYY